MNEHALKVLEFNEINASTAGSVEFGEGDRLAVRLFAQIEGGDCIFDDRDWMLVSINGCNGSSITMPASSPTYPTPELPTIALMSIGFVGLGGYIWFKKRRVAEAVS